MEPDVHGIWNLVGMSKNWQCLFEIRDHRDDLWVRPNLPFFLFLPKSFFTQFFFTQISFLLKFFFTKLCYPILFYLFMFVFFAQFYPFPFVPLFLSPLFSTSFPFFWTVHMTLWYLYLVHR